VADAVADAETSEAVDFRESTQGEDIVVLAEQFYGIGEVRSLSVFSVGFIENDEYVAGDLFEEGGEFSCPKGGARGIVRICDVHDTGLRGDGGGDGRKVEGKVLHAGLNEMAAAGANGDGEQRKRTLARDAFEAGTQENTRGKVNDFAGAEANKNFFGEDPETNGEDFPEALATAVGIPVGFAKGASGSFHGLRRGTERVFVGSKLDCVDLEILLDFFDGLARDVGREPLDVIGDEFFESVGHEFSLCRRLAFVEGDVCCRAIVDIRNPI